VLQQLSAIRVVGIVMHHQTVVSSEVDIELHPVRTLLARPDERRQGVLDVVRRGPTMCNDERSTLASHVPETFPLHDPAAEVPWTLFTDSQVPSRSISHMMGVAGNQGSGRMSTTILHQFRTRLPARPRPMEDQWR
jgi:hypothetical protein